MCLWPFSVDGHSSPTSSWRGFKAPQAYRGLHYHVMPVCTHCSSNLLVGPAAFGALSGWQHSSIFSQICRNIICPIQELVMAKLPERWAHYSTIYLYLLVFVLLCFITSRRVMIRIKQTGLRTTSIVTVKKKAENVIPALFIWQIVLYSIHRSLENGETV